MKSATKAGTRRYDVYMGMDVFGRNTFGGGGYQVLVIILLLHFCYKMISL